MTNEYELADDDREKLIWTKEQLLVPLLETMETPPHPMRLGNDEKDYYRLGGAGVSATGRAPGMAGPGGVSGPAMEATAARQHVVGQEEVRPGGEQVTHGGQEAEL
jgi:NADH-quinone oxidoreductase subunit I